MTTRIIIGGTSSNAGKTSVSIALCHALTKRGLTVQAFKAGPDFLDPTYLTEATGRACFNLDGWMTGREYVTELFENASANADVAVIEGVMGLFDGASASSSEGSAAELARWLDATVLLVADAGGVARSFAAVIHGFASFDPKLRLAGVVANRVGSPKHGDMLRLALESAPTELPPLLGAIPRGAFPMLPSRHLGLETADQERLPEESLDQLSSAVEEHIDIDRLLETSKCEDMRQSTSRKSRSPKQDEPVRIGIARDRAFHFYYRDILDALIDRGCELISFSPISDRALPEDLGGLILGGGYPEVYASELSANTSMHESIRDFADRGRPIYAECGGLMFLCAELEAQGTRYPMVGLFETRTRMLDRFKALRYVEVTLLEDSLWGRVGDRIRGHEFHYSELVADPAGARNGCRKVYDVQTRRGGATKLEGFQLEKDNVLASYCHLHYGPHQGALDRFVARCRKAQ